MEGRSYNAGLADARYKYIGEERDTETGFDAFGARYYDSRIGRFLTVDLLADVGQLRSWSAYHYSYDNPVRFSDPTGMAGDEKPWWVNQGWASIGGAPGDFRFYEQPGRGSTDNSQTRGQDNTSTGNSTENQAGSDGNDGSTGTLRAVAHGIIVADQVSQVLELVRGVLPKAATVGTALGQVVEKTKILGPAAAIAVTMTTSDDYARGKVSGLKATFETSSAWFSLGVGAVSSGAVGAGVGFYLMGLEAVGDYAMERAEAWFKQAEQGVRSISLQQAVEQAVGH